MAVDGVSSMKMSDVTQCSICLETYVEPKALPCIHTFCLQCLEQHCEDKLAEQVTCPLCRKIFTIPSGGLKDLPNNFLIHQLLEVKQSAVLAKNQNANKRLCEMCSDCDSEVTSYCIECDQHICDRCSAIHKKSKASMFHRLERGVDVSNDVSNSKKRIKLSVNYCNQHPGEQNIFFCDDCKMVSCHVCFVNKHSGHKLTDVNKSQGMLRQQLKIDVENVSACALNKLEHIKQLEIARNVFNKKVTTAEHEIYEIYDKLISLIQSHKNQLIEELNIFKVEILRDVETEKEDLERQVSIMKRFETDCLEGINKGTACDLSHTAHDLHARAEELLKIRDEPDCRRLSGVRITFKPSLSYPSLSTTDSGVNIIGELFLEDSSKDALKLDFSRFPGRLTTRYVTYNNIAVRIYGITVLGSEMFIARGTSQVDVYKSDDFAVLHSLTITGSRCLKNVVSCSHYSCLYFSDVEQKIVYKYDLVNDVTTYWSVSGDCFELSVTKRYNVLLTLCDTKRIQEYTTHGCLVREIRLDSSIEWPNHCVQLSTGNYVVSHTGGFHRVCIVDQTGHIIQSYGETSGSGLGQLNYPYHLSVDMHDNVLVSDCDNHRVQLLSPGLTYLDDIDIPGYQMNEPINLYFDKNNHRLYIVESENGRMFGLDVDFS